MPAYIQSVCISNRFCTDQCARMNIKNEVEEWRRKKKPNRNRIERGETFRIEKEKLFCLFKSNRKKSFPISVIHRGAHFENGWMKWIDELATSMDDEDYEHDEDDENDDDDSQDDVDDVDDVTVEMRKILLKWK